MGGAFRSRTVFWVPATARLLVAERDGLDAAHEIGEGRVQHQVVERVAVGGPDQLHAALCDRPRGRRLELGADLVDDDHLGHVVLDRLDHHRVLLGRGADLHPTRVADSRVRDIAVARDLVAGVDHDHPLAEVIRQHASHLPQHRRLADARPAEDQDALPRLDDLADDVDRAEDRSADAAGQPDDLAGSVANGADAVQRPLDAGPVVVPEDADVIDHVGDVGLGHLSVEELFLAVREAGLRAPAEVHHHLEQVGPVREGAQAIHDLGRERLQQGVQVVGRLLACHDRLVSLQLGQWITGTSAG